VRGFKNVESVFSILASVHISCRCVWVYRGFCRHACVYVCLRPCLGSFVWAWLQLVSAQRLFELLINSYSASVMIKRRKRRREVQL